MTDLALRRFRPADSERVRALHERALRDTGAYVACDEVETDVNADLRDVEASYLDGGEFLVGERDGTMVAMGAFRPVEGLLAEVLDVSDTTAELKRMRVAPEAQRRGYGQQVLDELERRARDRGFDEFVFDTSDRQDAARAFYEDNGYREVGRREVSFGDDSFTLLFYRGPC